MLYQLIQFAHVIAFMFLYGMNAKELQQKLSIREPEKICGTLQCEDTKLSYIDISFCNSVILHTFYAFNTIQVTRSRR